MCFKIISSLLNLVNQLKVVLTYVFVYEYVLISGGPN